MVHVTLSFTYPWNNFDLTEDEVRDSILEMSPNELIIAASNYGACINTDVEVY